MAEKTFSLLFNTEIQSAFIKMWQVPLASLHFHLTFIIVKKTASNCRKLPQKITYNLKQRFNLAYLPSRWNNLSRLPEKRFLDKNSFFLLFCFFDNTKKINFYFLVFCMIFFYNEVVFVFHFQRDFCIFHVHTVTSFVFLFLKDFGIFREILF